MVLSIKERIKGFLFSPSLTFDASKEDTFSDAFMYFLFLSVIYSVLFSIMMLAVFPTMLWLVAVMSWLAAGPVHVLAFLFFNFLLPHGLFAGGPVPVHVVALIILLLTSEIISILIIGLFLHLWVYIAGGQGGVIQTIKVVMYGETPYLLIGWIPVIGFITWIWVPIVDIIGIRQLHELSTGKAILAVIPALLLFTVPLIIIMCSTTYI